MPVATIPHRDTIDKKRDNNKKMKKKAYPPQVASLGSLQREGRSLASLHRLDGHPLSLDALDENGEESSRGVRPQLECVVDLHDAAETGPAHDGAHPGHGEEFIDLELGGSIEGVGRGLGVGPGRGEEVEEGGEEVEVRTSHVGDEEDGTHSFGGEIGCAADHAVPVGKKGVASSLLITLDMPLGTVRRKNLYSPQHLNTPYRLPQLITGV